MTAADPEVTIYFASFNTTRVSELCLRSMHATAGYPFRLVVGDCDSTDGSIEMFQRYEQAGLLSLEIARGGRSHGDWLDGWLSSSESRYVVFCDSDVEFLREGWLATMVDAAQRSSAALVATRIQAKDGVAYVHPATGATATLAPRPEPWLMLIDATLVRGVVDASFRYEERDLPDGSKMAYDTAAAFFRELVAANLHYVELPADFARSFRHYSGMTWQRRGIPLRRQAKQLGKQGVVLVRWARSQLVHRAALASAE